MESLPIFYHWRSRQDEPLLIARMKLLRSYKRRKLIGAARAGCATEFPSG
jgi:hypothetical protein